MSATPPSPDICLIVVNGSEFAMKAMAALEAAKDKLPAQYSIKQVALLKLKKIARPPHLVPIMSVDDKVIADSTDIVKFLDEHYGTDFFPKGEIGKKVAELEEESDTVLSVFLRYFAFYDNDGFSRGIKKQIIKMFGWLVGHLVIFFVLSKTRKEKRDDVKRLFPDVNAESREAVLAALGKLLKKYEDALPSEQQGYLCGTKGVSAADLAVYPMLMRFASSSGDAEIDPCVPGLLDSFPKLKAWLARMQRELPIRFRGENRRPREWPRPAALIADP